MTDGDEDDIGGSDRTGEIEREAQAACRTVVGDDRIEARLEDRDAALFKDADLFRIHIKAQHVVAHLRQTSPADQAHVPGSHHCDFHVVLN